MTKVITPLERKNLKEPKVGMVLSVSTAKSRLLGKSEFIVHVNGYQRDDCTWTGFVEPKGVWFGEGEVEFGNAYRIIVTRAGGFKENRIGGQYFFGAVPFRKQEHTSEDPFGEHSIVAQRDFEIMRFHALARNPLLVGFTENQRGLWIDNTIIQKDYEYMLGLPLETLRECDRLSFFKNFR